VTAGIIRREGMILIAKRPEGRHLAGFWEFPGGKQEAGEGLETCLKRELYEELGMEIQSAIPLWTVQHEYATQKTTLHFFDCPKVLGTPSPMEGQEIRWVSPKDLQTYTFPPPDRAIIDYLNIQCK
jgi:mutator protein MutT